MSEEDKRRDKGKFLYRDKKKNNRDKKKKENQSELVKTDSKEEKRRERWQMGEKYWLRLMDFKGQSSMLYNSTHNSRD